MLSGCLLYFGKHGFTNQAPKHMMKPKSGWTRRIGIERPMGLADVDHVQMPWEGGFPHDEELAVHCNTPTRHDILHHIPVPTHLNRFPSSTPDFLPALRLRAGTMTVSGVEVILLFLALSEGLPMMGASLGHSQESA